MGMMESLAQLREEAEAKLKSSKSSEELEQLLVDVLGRNGSLTTILRAMGKLESSERASVGAFANNQVAAVGVLKILVPIGMILPISAMFVPESWQLIYGILPMYWQYRALSAILSGEPALMYSLFTFVVSVPWFAATLWLFTKKTNFRNSLR